MKIKNYLPITIGIMGLLFSAGSASANSKNVALSTDHLQNVVLEKPDNHTFYDGNKLKIKSNDLSSKEKDEPIFSDDFTNGLSNWTVSPNGSATIVKDPTLDKNVVKIDRVTDLQSKKIYDIVKAPGLYRLTMQYKTNTVAMRPYMGFYDGASNIDFSANCQAPFTNDKWQTQSYIFASHALNSLGFGALNPSNMPHTDDNIEIANISVEKITPTESTNFSDGNLHGWQVGPNTTSSFVDTPTKGKVLQLNYAKNLPLFPQEVPASLLYKTATLKGATDKQVEGIAMFAQFSGDIGKSAEIGINVVPSSSNAVMGFTTTPSNLDDYTTLESYPFAYNTETNDVPYKYGLLAFRDIDSAIHLNNKINITNVDVYKGIIINLD